MAPTKKPRKSNNHPKKPTGAVTKNKDFLRVFVKHGKTRKDVKKLVDLANKDEINAISEILYNAMRGNIRLTPSAIKQLHKHRKSCEQLVRKDVSFTRKKRILRGQTGGFIGAILSALGGSLLKPIIERIAGR